MSHLTTNLKALRKRKGLTQEQVYKDLEMKKSTYSNYETGHTSPGILELESLSEYFGVTIDDLIKKDISFEEKLREQSQKHLHKQAGSKFKRQDLPMHKIAESETPYSTIPASELLVLVSKRMRQMEEDIEKLKQAAE